MASRLQSCGALPWLAWALPTTRWTPTSQVGIPEAGEHLPLTLHFKRRLWAGVLASPLMAAPWACSVPSEGVRAQAASPRPLAAHGDTDSQPEAAWGTGRFRAHPPRAHICLSPG